MDEQTNNRIKSLEQRMDAFEAKLKEIKQTEDAGQTPSSESSLEIYE